MLSCYPLTLWLVLSSQATACLFCFSSKGQRFRICQYFLGHQSPQHGACLEALRTAFLPCTKIQVDLFSTMNSVDSLRQAASSQLQKGIILTYRYLTAVLELEKLKHIFTKVIFYLEEKGMAKVPYRQAFSEAVGEVQKEVVNLKAAAACIPPCGVQDLARRYKCDSCRIVDCQLPVDCPLTALHKAAGDTTLLKCEANFTLPSGTTVRWKFAKDLNTQQLSLFKDLHFGYSSSLLIRPTLGSHYGTYICQIAEEKDILIRKYFFLNVTTKRLGREKEMQKMFRDILNPPEGMKPEEVVVAARYPSLQEILSQPDYLRKKNVVLLIIGLALSSMLLTLAALTIYYWATDIDQEEPH